MSTYVVEALEGRKTKRRDRHMLLRAFGQPRYGSLASLVLALSLACLTLWQVWERSGSGGGRGFEAGWNGSEDWKHFRYLVEEVVTQHNVSKRSVYQIRPRNSHSSWSLVNSRRLMQKEEEEEELQQQVQVGHLAPAVDWRMLKQDQGSAPVADQVNFWSRSSGEDGRRFLRDAHRVNQRQDYVVDSGRDREPKPREKVAEAWAEDGFPGGAGDQEDKGAKMSKRATTKRSKRRRRGKKKRTTAKVILENKMLARIREKANHFRAKLFSRPGKAKEEDGKDYEGDDYNLGDYAGVKNKKHSLVLGRRDNVSAAENRMRKKKKRRKKAGKGRDGNSSSVEEKGDTQKPGDDSAATRSPGQDLAEAGGSCPRSSLDEGYEVCGHRVAVVRPVRGEEGCQLKCLAHRSCHFWTYDSRGEDEDSRRGGGVCTLLDERALCERRKSRKRAIVLGPKKCTKSGIKFDYSKCESSGGQEDCNESGEGAAGDDLDNSVAEDRVRVESTSGPAVTGGGEPGAEGSTSKAAKEEEGSGGDKETSAIVENLKNKQENNRVDEESATEKAVCTLESFEKGIDLCGHDIGVPPADADDPLDCQEKCEKQDGCEFWTFKPDEGKKGGKCQMKDKHGMCDARRKGVPKEVISGPKKCTVAGVNVDLSGCKKAPECNEKDSEEEEEEEDEDEDEDETKESEEKGSKGEAGKVKSREKKEENKERKEDSIRCTDDSYARDTELCSHAAKGVKPVHVSTDHDCQHLCSREEKCEFWTFYPSMEAGGNGGGECRMKDEMALCGKRNRTGAVTGPKKCTKHGVIFDDAVCKNDPEMEKCFPKKKKKGKEEEKEEKESSEEKEKKKELQDREVLVICTSESFAHGTELCLHNTGTKVNTTDYMACQKACESDGQCKFWTYYPNSKKGNRRGKRRRRKTRGKRGKKNKTRRKRGRRPKRAVNGQSGTDRKKGSKGSKGAKGSKGGKGAKGKPGGLCVFKNELALCARRDAKGRGAVSGPKKCTPEGISFDDSLCKGDPDVAKCNADKKGGRVFELTTIRPTREGPKTTLVGEVKCTNSSYDHGHEFCGHDVGRVTDVLSTHECQRRCVFTVLRAGCFPGANSLL